MGRIGWVTGFTEVHCTWKHNTALQGNTSNSSMLNVVNSDLLSECFPPEHENDLKKQTKTPLCQSSKWIQVPGISLFRT